MRSPTCKWPNFSVSVPTWIFASLPFSSLTTNSSPLMEMMSTTKCLASCIALSAAECDNRVHTPRTKLGNNFIAPPYATLLSSIATRGKGNVPRINCRSCYRRPTSHDETYRSKNQEHDEQHIGDLSSCS